MDTGRKSTITSAFGIILLMACSNHSGSTLSTESEAEAEALVGGERH